MKKNLARYLLLCLSVACGCLSANAQNATLSAAAGDRYIISAKAGGVNFVEGAVTVARKSGTSGYLVKGDTLEIGDRVSTGANGKAEILLNPGSFVRLSGNSAFEFKTTELDDLQVQLDSGSAILEVFAAAEFKVSISTPKRSFILIETGVYRVDVLNGRESRLEVWRGSAMTGGSEVIKSGRVALASGSGRVAVSKFDRDDKDALDVWSKNRSKELAKLTAGLKRTDLRADLMRSFLGRGWNMFNSFGLWIFDPFSGGYCFLPFGYGWNSPYGYGYGHSMWWYEMPPVVYMPPSTGGTPNGGGPTPPTSIPLRIDRSPIPPFVRLEQTTGGGLNGGSPGRRGSSSDSGSSSSPSYSPSSSSSSSPSGNATTKTDPTGTKQP